MSKGAEKILRRMIQPNADLRCTAPEALQDPYWGPPPSASAHKRAASGGIQGRSRSRNVISPLSSRRASKTQQSESEHAEIKQDDKENVPVTTPNTKKGPHRQRVLSGTDGKFFYPC
jgi:serine/threonine-protein kinase GIN4